MSVIRVICLSLMASFTAVMVAAIPAAAQQKPNILVIFGDDIGQTNISAYALGVVGYKTPNIDRIAREGMIFTDYYAENSCTAGRSSFITGQTPKRTGLSKVGIPARQSGFKRRTSPSPRRSKLWAMPPANSARTISATATSFSLRFTASTNSSATFIT
jgi:hypothetical protein